MQPSNLGKTVYAQRFDFLGQNPNADQSSHFRKTAVPYKLDISEQNPNVAQLTTAINENDINTVREIVGSKKVLVNGSSLGARVAVVQAISNNKPEILDFLLQSGANVDTTNAQGIPVLHIAAVNECVECARLLLKHNANINQTVPHESGDFTALHALARAIDGRGLTDAKKECVRLLIENGVDRSLVGAGKTAEEIAPVITEIAEKLASTSTPRP